MDEASFSVTLQEVPSKLIGSHPCIKNDVNVFQHVDLILSVYACMYATQNNTISFFFSMLLFFVRCISEKKNVVIYAMGHGQYGNVILLKLKF